eukprot:CAMPEP_0206261010 /NCGR_PEP_ID=MMETSP0047_2-20121206/27408_1 /ASSEMBLY_ACC=CAM_ASM_000192 /TAXON_ID=195065 /ORGANISM="Chroomonas mesostigmatica_cf, Strain CCMP1168" /LENGTH=109 /DNA_ID=CAMNT_0053688159 /DNA_START=39 /DNA_END=368 /DNA_ORIENTATION=+
MAASSPIGSPHNPSPTTRSGASPHLYHQQAIFGGQPPPMQLQQGSPMALHQQHQQQGPQLSPRMSSPHVQGHVQQHVFQQQQSPYGQPPPSMYMRQTQLYHPPWGQGPS